MFDAEAEKAKVLEHAAGLLAAENAKEPEKASGFYSDNVYFVAPGMDIVNGNAKLKEVLVAALTGSFTNSHEYLDVQFSEGGDMCFVVLKYSISTDDPEFNFPKSGKGIFVMQKKNGKWEIAVNCFNA